MADLAFMAELDASRFNREIDRMDSRTRDMEQRFSRLDGVMSKVLGTAALFKAVQFANSSLDAWASQHDQARAKIEAHRSAWQGLKSDIGSDLIGIIPETTAQSAREKRNTAVDATADVLKGEDKTWWKQILMYASPVGAAMSLVRNEGWDGKSGDVRSLQQQDASLQKDMARERRFTNERLRVHEQLQTDIAALSDKPEEVERIRYERRRREIRQNQNLDADAKQKAMQLEDEHHSKAMTRIQERREAEEARRQNELQVRREELQFDIERDRIEIDMINARGVDAEIDRMRLQTAEQIARIKRDELLTQEEKDAAIVKISGNADRRETAIRQKAARDAELRQRFEVLELAGVADAATRRQIIGSGEASTERVAATTERTAAATEKTAETAEMTHEVLQSIDQFIRGGLRVSAHYGR